MELKIVFIHVNYTADDARRWMNHIDSELGVNLPEQDYGGNCRIYDPDNKADPWHNLKVF